MTTRTMPIAACLLLSWALVVNAAPVKWSLASGGNGRKYEGVSSAGRVTWDAAKEAAQSAARPSGNDNLRTGEQLRVARDQPECAT